ncbi:hypothetical protein D3C72_1327970 [compost metagenome]
MESPRSFAFTTIQFPSELQVQRTNRGIVVNTEARRVAVVILENLIHDSHVTTIIEHGSTDAAVNREA